MLMIMSTIYKQSSLMHVLLIVGEQYFIRCKTFFWGTIRKDCRFPWEDLQDSPDTLEKPTLLPTRRGCLSTLVGLLCAGEPVARFPPRTCAIGGAVPPSHSPVETHTGRTYPRYPAHCPVMGIARRRRDLGRERETAQRHERKRE